VVALVLADPLVVVVASAQAAQLMVVLVLADPLVVVVASAKAAQLMVVLVLADPLVGRRPLVLVAPV